MCADLRAQITNISKPPDASLAQIYFIEDIRVRQIMRKYVAYKERERVKKKKEENIYTYLHTYRLCYRVNCTNYAIK